MNDRVGKEIALLKKNMKRRRPHMTEDEYSEVLGRHIKIIENTDWDKHDRYRRREAKRLKALGLPPTATLDDRLLMLAERLGIPVKEYRRGSPESDDKDWERLWAMVGRELGFLQPEFWKPLPGRPQGRPNKQLSATGSKETLRKRRYRDKIRRDKY